MTHDELLRQIDSVFYENEGGMQLDFAKFNNQYRAIRAVVELHTFVHSKRGKSGLSKRCTECGFAYPCPTIEAIKGEFNLANV